MRSIPQKIHFRRLVQLPFVRANPKLLRDAGARICPREIRTQSVSLRRERFDLALLPPRLRLLWLR